MTGVREALRSVSAFGWWTYGVACFAAFGIGYVIGILRDVP